MLAQDAFSAPNLDATDGVPIAADGGPPATDRGPRATDRRADRRRHSGAGQNVGVRPAVDYRPLLDPPFRDPNLKPDAQAIQAFAVTNGWEYYVGTGGQSLPGVVFREASGRSRKLQRAGNIVRIPGSPLIEVGNSAYSVTVNLNLMSITWGYVAVPLNTPLPPLVVESARARELSPLPSLPVGAAQVPFGGADAALVGHIAPAAADWLRTVLTPELVALLDGPRLPVNVEVAEGWLFLYAPHELSTPDPAVWERAFTVLDAVSKAFGTDAGAPAAGNTSAASAPTSPAVPAPAPVAASLPAPAAPPAPAPASALPMKEDSGRVNRGRTFAFYGAALGVFVLLAAGVALLMPH